jgi:hypothetical protein
MALQIRRGTTAERTARRFLVGELIYDTELQQVFVGDSPTGTTGTLGGKAVTAFTQEDAQDAIQALLTAGAPHGNIGFSYNDVGNALTVAVNLSNYIGNIGATGTITANGFNGWLEGNVFANDSTLLVDAGNGLIPASVVQGTFTGPVSGNVTGNVTGNVSGNLTGNVTGNVVATDATVLINGTSKQIGYTGASLVGNLVGSVTGNVITSLIDSSDSSPITVTPSVVMSSNLTVENIANINDAIFTGNVLFNLSTNQPAVIDLIDVSTINSEASVLKLNLRPQNNLSSGPGIEFTVGPSDPGAESQANLAKIVAKQESASGGIELKTWEPSSNTFVTGVGVLPDYVFFNRNRLALNNSAFFTHSEEFPAVTTTTGDITLYPETNQVIVYANVLPGLEDDGLGDPVPSGTYNLGSDTARFNNAYLNGGVVTTAPTTSAGKEGDVAGAVAFDGSYVYRCTTTYTDGLSAIWTRAPLTFSSF